MLKPLKTVITKLWRRYCRDIKNLVYAKSKPYFLAGADDDDIIQEGLIGLYKAVMDFDGDRFPFLKSLREYA